jgi:hypothetical protein
MPQMDSDSIAAVQPELVSGEQIVWAYRPRPGIVFHKQDIYLIPFSLFWGGFAIFWEASVSGHGMFGGKGAAPGFFFQLWGIPFVLIGQYLIWGRFLFDAWLKRRTYYAVTNRRVIVVQNGLQHKIASSYLDSLPTVTKEAGSNGAGLLRFSPAQPLWSNRRGWSAWNSMSVGDVPTFVDVEDVDSVYRLVSDLREKARTPQPAF